MGTTEEKNDSRKNGILPQKEFKARNSILTDLYEINHFKSLRHCFVAVIIISFMNILICDMLGTGSVSYGLRYLIIGFGNIDYVILMWIIMFAFTLMVHPAFSFWANIRIKLDPKSGLLQLWDRACLVTLISYMLLLLYIPPYVKGYLPIASSAIVLSEQIRFFMKTHGFIRTNVPIILGHKLHTEKEVPISKFSKYLYYLFIPTFIYREEYPRTSHIRWSFVILNFSEFWAGISFFCFLTANYLAPDFQNFGIEPQDWRNVATLVFRTILPASLFMLVGFYIVLHAWMNAWAELMCFADRLFYQDWWNTDTYAAYYRKWNIVVHDYLHTFIYRDMYEIVAPGNKVVATCSVFFISALVHEYIIGFMLGYFFPIMLIQFGFFGMTLTFVKIKGKHVIGNTFLWWSLSVGIGMQISLYAMEYYARVNCPRTNEKFIDYFIPRILSCN